VTILDDYRARERVRLSARSTHEADALIQRARPTPEAVMRSQIAQLLEAVKRLHADQQALRAEVERLRSSAAEATLSVEEWAAVNKLVENPPLAPEWVRAAIHAR